MRRKKRGKRDVKRILKHPTKHLIIIADLAKLILYHPSMTPSPLHGQTYAMPLRSEIREERKIIRMAVQGLHHQIIYIHTSIVFITFYAQKATVKEKKNHIYSIISNKVSRME